MVSVGVCEFPPHVHTDRLYSTMVLRIMLYLQQYHMHI